jgi:hypothetical protein
MIEKDCCGVMRGWLQRLCVCVCCFSTACSSPRAHACCFRVRFAVLVGHYHVSICALRRASYATAFDPCARSLPRGLNLSIETELERCSAVRAGFICKFTRPAYASPSRSSWHMTVHAETCPVLCHRGHPLTALHTPTCCSTPSRHPLLRYVTVAHHRCSHTCQTFRVAARPPLP